MSIVKEHFEKEKRIAKAEIKKLLKNVEAVRSDNDTYPTKCLVMDVIRQQVAQLNKEHFND